MDWIDNVTEISQETLDEGGPTFPWIQWVNGKPGAKQIGGVAYHGGWFMPRDNAPADELPGWNECTLVHEDGSETEGYCRRDLKLAVIRWRRAWRTNGRMFPWDAYDKAVAEGHPSGKTQVLAAVEGIDVPMVLTLSGTTGRAFMQGRGESVMGDLRRYVIEPANRLSRQRGKSARWAWRAFWLTVGPKEGFSTVGQPGAQSQVTPPVAVGLKDGMTPQQIGTLYVGNDNLRRHNEWYADAEKWALAWDGFERTNQEPEWAEETEEVPF